MTFVNDLPIAGCNIPRKEMIKILEQVKTNCLAQPDYKMDVEPIETVTKYLQREFDNDGPQIYCSLAAVFFNVYHRAILNRKGPIPQYALNKFGI